MHRTRPFDTAPEARRRRDTVGRNPWRYVVQKKRQSLIGRELHCSLWLYNTLVSRPSQECRPLLIYLVDVVSSTSAGNLPVKRVPVTQPIAPRIKRSEERRVGKECRSLR